MRINHNIAALNTYRQLGANNATASKNIERLSSGLRINRAGDDAAGLAISEKMRAQIRGLDMATRNAQDGISMIQTAEGALNETHSILQRMRELSVQSSNDTATDSDRKELQKEISQLKQEVDRISNSTEFNTKKLLNGDLSTATKAQGDILDSAQLKFNVTDNLKSSAVDNALQITSGNNKIKIQTSTLPTTKLSGDPTENALNYSTITGSITLSGMGAAVNFTVASGIDTLSGLAAAINTQIDAALAASGGYSSGAVDVSISGTALKFTTGSSGIIKAITGLSGTYGVSSTASGASVGGTAITTDAYKLTSGNNSFKIGSTTVDVATGTYTTLSGLAAAINTALDSNSGTSSIDVSVSGTKILFTSTASGSATLSSGDSFLSDFGINSGSISGISVTSGFISLDSGFYTASGLAAQINTKLSGASFSGLTASVSGSTLKFTDASAGKNYTILAGASGTANTSLGISSDITATSSGVAAASGITKNAINLSSSNNSFTVTVNGSGKTVDIASGGYTSLSGLATAISTALSTAGVSGLSASVDGSGIKLSVASGNTDIYKFTSASSDSGLATLGITSGTVLTKQATITSLQDSDGNNLGIASGNVIKINGQVNGSGVSEIALNVTSSTTQQDLQAKIESAFGLSSGSVSITSSGKIEIKGKNGEANDLQDIKLSIDGNAKFNNYFSNFAETQDAQDDKTNNALSFHIGANEGQTMKIDISEMSVGSLSLSSVDISTQQGGENSITVINNAIEKVSAERAKLGAYQNRLEHSINNLGTSSENLTAAESRIRDVDMAKEMMEFTKNNILSQASQAMLAQANQQPQGVLQLLR